MENERTSKGYVYVLINTSMPNLVKIGKTTKEPNERVKELSSATGVATPFILVYYRQFNNCHSAERKIHILLEDKGARFSNSREFFEISTTDAIHIVQTIDEEEANNEFAANSVESNNDNIGFLYFKKGANYQDGDNGCFQDYYKAIEYYKKSAEYGLFLAHFSIGFIYQEHLDNIRMAINEYQKGAEKGDIRCYFHLAMIYMLERGFINERNANIAWEKFFANLHQLPLSTLLLCLRIYLFNALKKNFPIDCRWYPTIQSLKNELIEDIEQNRSTSNYSDVLKFLRNLNPDTDIAQYRMDTLFVEAATFIVQEQKGVIFLFEVRNKLKLDENSTERLMERLEKSGIIGPAHKDYDSFRVVKVKTQEELMQILQKMGLIEGVSKQLEGENKVQKEENIENAQKSKSWFRKFFALLPSIIVMLVICIPVGFLLYWMTESVLVCLIVLPFLLFLPFK